MSREQIVVNFLKEIEAICGYEDQEYHIARIMRVEVRDRIPRSTTVRSNNSVSSLAMKYNPFDSASHPIVKSVSSFKSGWL